jgi:hypothetical protein
MDDTLGERAARISIQPDNQVPVTHSIHLI